jgi:DNA oxidative demethylase
MGRMRGIIEEPTGFRYVPSLLSEDEERELLEHLQDLQFDEVRMHGQVARRVVRHFGVQYAFESAAITPGPPIPDWLTAVHVCAAQLLDVSPAALAEALITYYPPGAAIGWHRDAPVFGDIVGVSLRSACEMRFQHGQAGGRHVFQQRLEPRSAYILAGPARNRWQHSIPEVADDRYSLTFRTLRRRPEGVAAQPA